MLNEVLDATKIPFVLPEFHCSDDLLDNIRNILESGIVTNNGPIVRRFEEQMATYMGAKHVVAVSSGSMALLLSLTALDLKPGKVVLPAYTYISTLNAIVHRGLEPLFCDIDPTTYTMDPDHLEHLIQHHPDIRCVIPVNVFGVHPDLEVIAELCRQEIPILYDNAHGLGTQLNGRLLPSEPDVQIFSLHATKVFPAIEGGLIVVSDEQTKGVIETLRNHGLSTELHKIRNGYNAKLDEVRAIIGLNTLSRFEETLASRREIGAKIQVGLKKYADLLALQSIPPGIESNYQNLAVLFKRKLPSEGIEGIVQQLQGRGLMARRYFHPPLHLIEGFKGQLPLPRTEHVWHHSISLPIHSSMSDSALQKMFAIVDETCEELG